MVCKIFARPIISWIILGLTFLEQSKVAHVCRVLALREANSLWDRAPW